MAYAIMIPHEKIRENLFYMAVKMDSIMKKIGCLRSFWRLFIEDGKLRLKLKYN